MQQSSMFNYFVHILLYGNTFEGSRGRVRMPRVYHRPERQVSARYVGGAGFSAMLEFLPVSEQIIIAPARTIAGTVEVPGDKSISHRYAILAALAKGRSEIARFSAAADCRSSLECVAQLGAKVEKIAEDRRDFRRQTRAAGGGHHGGGACGAAARERASRCGQLGNHDAAAGGRAQRATV